MTTGTMLNKVLILWWSINLCTGLSCDSCGRECAAACGTRNFRTCCFNYLKKRSVDPPAVASEMRLELLMVIPELMQFYAQPLGDVMATVASPLTSSGFQLLYQDKKNNGQTGTFN